jgi:hypothetical protein
MNNRAGTALLGTMIAGHSENELPTETKDPMGPGGPSARQRGLKHLLLTRTLQNP